MATTATSRSVFSIAGIPIGISTDDPDFLREFASLFDGGQPPATVPTITVDVDLSRRTVVVDGDHLADPATFLSSFSSPDIPISLHDTSTPAAPVLAVAGEPMFTFDGTSMRFGTHPRWRRMLSHVLFLRALRLRPDAIFLHAASVSIRGRGVLLIGPKGSGKTTLSAALASRGHDFLGDETAMYLPENGTLVPFLRPLSVKRGPAARSVDRALGGRWGDADEDGVLRVGISEIGGSAAMHSVPLDSVIFLRGFGSEPQLERIAQAGRDETASLQPLGSSLAGDAGRRVFAMFRMLSNRALFQLRPGDPDRTAALIEEAIVSL